MDFNRSGHLRPTAAPVATAAAAPQKATSTQAPQKDNWKQSSLYRFSFIALLVSATILFVALIFYIVFGPPINREAGYVDTDKYQAVFVNVNGTNGGQVYFGKITSLTPQHIRLVNVFYIQNQSAGDAKDATSAYNLVKLGCELHGPTDEMIINRSEVFFWENLKNDGQVAQKAAEYYKQNQNGQKCSSTTNSTQQSTTSTQQPATTTTPPASTDATKKN